MLHHVMIVLELSGAHSAVVNPTLLFLLLLLLLLSRSHPIISPSALCLGTALLVPLLSWRPRSPLAPRHRQEKRLKRLGTRLRTYGRRFLLHSGSPLFFLRPTCVSTFAICDSHLSCMLHATAYAICQVHVGAGVGMLRPARAIAETVPQISHTDPTPP